MLSIHGDILRIVETTGIEEIETEMTGIEEIGIETEMTAGIVVMIDTGMETTATAMRMLVNRATAMV